MPMHPLQRHASSTKCLLAAAALAFGPIGLAPSHAAAQDAPATTAPASDSPATEDFSLAGLERFTTVAELNDWFSNYRHTHAVERVPAAIVAYSEFGCLSGNRPLVILSAFFAEIVRTHPDKYRERDAILRDGNEAERWLLWNAIWWSGLDDTEEFFIERIKTARERDRKTIQYFLDNDPHDLKATPVDSEIVLVVLAYSYFGGGDPIYLHRMAEPLKTPAMGVTEFQRTGPNKSEEFAGAASRLFVNYAAGHDDIVAFCQDLAVNGDEWQQKRMNRILMSVGREREIREIQPNPIILRPDDPAANPAGAPDPAETNPSETDPAPAGPAAPDSDE